MSLIQAVNFESQTVARSMPIVSLASFVVIPYWFSPWPGEIESFKDHLNTHAHQTSLKKGLSESRLFNF